MSLSDRFGFCSKCRTIAPICCSQSVDTELQQTTSDFCWACCDCGRLGRTVAGLKQFSRLTGDVDIDEMLRACIKTFQTKGAEYTIGSPDRLANFRGAAADADIPMEKVWWIFFNKHLRAVQYYIKHGKVESNEPIDGRIMDCIVYLLLFSKMVKEKEGNNGRPKEHDPAATA